MDFTATWLGSPRTHLEMVDFPWPCSITRGYTVDGSDTVMTMVMTDSFDRNHKNDGDESWRAWGC